MKTQKGYTRYDLSSRFSSPASLAVMAVLLSIALLPGCAPKTPDTAENPILRTCSPEKLFANKHSVTKSHQMRVTATAYTAQSCGHAKNSRPKAANGECLTPDVSAIAVSPDLIARHGIRMNQSVRLEGFDGEFKVMDLMSSRLQKTIDIYFGNNQAAARQWGRRTLLLSWN